MRTIPKFVALGLVSVTWGCTGAPPAAGTTAPRAPTVPTPDRSTAREGVTPPQYKPSSHSPAPIPITDNAYGAFGAAEGAPQLGDTFPDFELPLSDGGTYELAEARGAGPVLVMFYRGFW